MKRALLILLICLMAALFAATAFGANGVYVSGRAGTASLKAVQLEETKVDFDPGIFASGALGYGLEEGRLEAEISYRQNEIKQIVLQKGNKFDPGGNFSTLSFMLNSIADYKTATTFSPYVFVGAGAAWISLEEDLSLGVDLKASEDFFLAYQAGAGLGYALTKRLSLDLEYRYFAAVDTKFETTTGDEIKFDYAIHNASLGLRYAF